MGSSRATRLTAIAWVVVLPGVMVCSVGEADIEKSNDGGARSALQNRLAAGLIVRKIEIDVRHAIIGDSRLVRTKGFEA